MAESDRYILQALHDEVAEHRHGPVPVAGVGRRPEAPEPVEQGELRPGPYVEWALRVEHPSQSLPHDAGLGERHAVAGDYQSGIAVGGARADVLLVDQEHFPASLGQEIGGAYAENAASDDEHIVSAGGTRSGHPAKALFMSTRIILGFQLSNSPQTPHSFEFS